MGVYSPSSPLKGAPAFSYEYALKVTERAGMIEQVLLSCLLVGTWLNLFLVNLSFVRSGNNRPAFSFLSRLCYVERVCDEGDLGMRELGAR